jgi:hypothetical protein
VISANHESSTDEKVFYFGLDVGLGYAGIGRMGALPKKS